MSFINVVAFTAGPLSLRIKTINFFSRNQEFLPQEMLVTYSSLQKLYSIFYRSICRPSLIPRILENIRGILIFNQDLWGIEEKREIFYWCFAEFFCKVRKVYRKIFLLKFYLMVRLVFFSSSRLLGCPQGLIPSMPPSNCNSILLLNSSSFSGVFCFY